MASRDNDSDAFNSSTSPAPSGASRGGKRGANSGDVQGRRRLNDGIKQRIVGALVLAALAVIFLPTLFDREGARYIDVTSQIPAPPDIKPIVIAEPQPVEAVEPAPPVNEVFQPDFVEQISPAPDPETVSLPAGSPPEPAGQSASQGGGKPGPAAAEDPRLQLQLPAEETQLDGQGLPEGWVVQVAAYKESASAERMRGKLMDAGFRAYTRAVDTPKGRFVRVFVGPKLSRTDAQSEKRKLDKLLKTETLILRYRA